MRCGEAASASSAASANSGVPAKAMSRGVVMGRPRASHGGGGAGTALLTFAFFLLDALPDALTLQVREVVHEQLAVEMVDLVLDADREQAVGVELQGLALRVQRPHPDALRPL